MSVVGKSDTERLVQDARFDLAWFGLQFVGQMDDEGESVWLVGDVLLVQDVRGLG